MGFFQKRFKAFRYAFVGLVQAFRREDPVKVHTLAAFVAIAASFYFNISRMEWLAVLGCIGLVFIIELINTAIEKLCDLAHPEQHPLVGYVKDITAASVLIACLFAVVTACVIFLPRLC
jgi:diacylglycerol kinase